MAYVITDACTRCDECIDLCPVGAIYEGDPKYRIDADECCDFEHCLAVCDYDAIVMLEADEPSDG